MLSDVGVQFGDRRPVILISATSAIAAAGLGLAAVISPPLALAGACAILFAIVTVRNLTAGLVCFIVLSFFDRASALTSSGLSPSKLVGLVLALVWALLVFNRESDVPILLKEYPALGLLAIAFVGWSFTSALWSVDSFLAISTTFRLILSLLLVFIVFSAVRERRHVRWLVWAFMAGVIFAQLIGILHLESAQQGRLQGGFDDPNQLASVDLAAIAMAAFAFVAFRGRSIRWVAGACAGLFTVTLVHTESQAAIVGFFVVLALAVAFSGRARRVAVTSVTAFLLVATLYYTVHTRPVLLDTIASSQNVGARETLWRVAEQATMDHPILGVGAGNFIRVAPGYTFENINLPRFDAILVGHVVHNTYLEVLTELGPLGLTLLLSLIACNFVLGVRAVRRFERAGEWELEMLTRGVLIGTAGMLVASTFATATYEKHLWFLLAFGPAVAGLAERLPLRRAEMAEPPQVPVAGGRPIPGLGEP